MSIVDKCQYQIFELSSDQKEYFIGSGFAVRGQNSAKLVTAAHVAYESRSNQRKLLAKSYQGSYFIDGLYFVQKGYKDIAETELDPGQVDTLEFGSNVEIIIGNDLKIRPVYLRRNNKPESKLTVVQIGGLDLSRRGNKPINPKYETTFDYIGNSEQPAWPGCSGSPILDKNNLVVGVHIRGTWNNGQRYNMAHIYTQENES